MVIKTQRPSVRNMSYESAAGIIHDYAETDPYLRSLISNHVPDAELVLSCSDPTNLKYYGRTIRGVAEKILRSHPVAKNIIRLKKTTDKARRQDLEERICLQLEGGNYPDNSWVANFYNWAKNVYP
jgi:hypothetical protein